jgi:tRNA pseudouridine-54 N-methylase
MVIGDNEGLTDEEESQLVQHCAQFPNVVVGPVGNIVYQTNSLSHSFSHSLVKLFTQVKKFSLGPVSLLGSHCIVLAHHYLDQIHFCSKHAAGESQWIKQRSTNVQANTISSLSTSMGMYTQPHPK